MDLITQVLQYWGLHDADAIPVELTSQTTWSVDEKYILKKFRSAEDLSSCVKFFKLMASHDIPVAEIIPTKSGELTPPDELYCLMVKLPGIHVNFYEKPELAVELGRNLAMLHLALSDIDECTDYHDSNLLEDWQNKIKPSLNDVPKAVIKSTDMELGRVFPLLPRQLIHRDFHPQNVLYEGNQISGWLDFDLSHKNVRIFDIAYFLAGLLVNNIQDPDKIKIWNIIYHNLLQGYIEVNQLTDNEINAIPIIMIVIEFLFVWYWGEQNNTKQRDAALDIAMWLFAR